jgi:hypothetical protein
MSRPLSAAPRPNSEPGSTVPLSCSRCFDTTSTVTTTDSGNYVHFGCLDICSLYKQFDDIVALISDFDLSVLCLTETWVDEDNSAAVLVFRSSISLGRDHATISRSTMAVLPLLRRQACRCLLFLTGLLFPVLSLLPVLFLLVGVESPLLSFIGLQSRLPSLMISLPFSRGWRCCFYPSSLLGILTFVPTALTIITRCS